MANVIEKNRLERQKRHIEMLQAKVDELTKENESLKNLNKGFLEKYDLTEKARQEYLKMIEELKVLKFKYYNAYRDAAEMKRKYRTEFNDHLSKIRKQNKKE